MQGRVVRVRSSEARTLAHWMCHISEVREVRTFMQHKVAGRRVELGRGDDQASNTSLLAA